jgi:hypothetical protein
MTDDEDRLSTAKQLFRKLQEDSLYRIETAQIDREVNTVVDEYV